MEKVSLVELNHISSVIQMLIKKDKKAKFSRDLLYALYKNVSIINKEVEIIKEQLVDQDEEYTEYNTELYALAVKHGAEETVVDGRQTIKEEELKKLPKEYTKAADKLKLKYKEAIERQEENTKQNRELATDKLSAPDWYEVSLDLFPEELNYEDFPYELVDYGIIVNN